MSTWLTEKEFRQSGADATGVTLNVAFFQEIKQDNLPVRQQTSRLCRMFAGGVSPRSALDSLLDFQEDLETYFALEEFYGYFHNASIHNPVISTLAVGLKSEHESLFLQLANVIDLAEQIVYQECGPNTSITEVAELFDTFANRFDSHEQQEMDLMMRLCNEELGVAD